MKYQLHVIICVKIGENFLFHSGLFSILLRYIFFGIRIVCMEGRAVRIVSIIDECRKLESRSPYQHQPSAYRAPLREPFVCQDMKVSRGYYGHADSCRRSLFREALP